jgi:NAD(P)-dependent dehydrogenase (short-subunit alcohol dehydrogenase family)
MDSNMSGKVVIVTGASSGIGRECVLKFAAAGCKVVAVARSQDKLGQLVDQTGALEGQVRPVVADLTRDADIPRIVSETVSAFGGIDILVNVAGVLKNGTILNTSTQDWDHLMNVNVRAPFLLMREAMPYLIERKGNVVNVSSVNGQRAFPGVLAYCASKAALDQLTHCAALEVAEKGVRVNAVNPGVTLTNLHRNSGMQEDAYAGFLERSKSTHPLGRVGRPEEVADLVYFLASPKAGWITGVSYAIDGGRGQTCLR